MNKIDSSKQIYYIAHLGKVILGPMTYDKAVAYVVSKRPYSSEYMITLTTPEAR